MFFDTSHNSPQAVFKNIYTAFLETATKMWAYARCLPKANKPSMAVVQDTLKSLVDVAYLLLTSRSRKMRYPGYVCVVGKRQVAWLVMSAFREVLGRKQAGYGAVVDWIRSELLKLEMEGVHLDGKSDGKKTKMERRSGGNELAVLRRVVNEAGRGKYRGGT
ncbi:hypothetical protein QBC37DRAFT_407958 [Rhypophila decipiens]|uniref:Telomerase reverse transcriptase n=1 Tax=Rhypophila decipiens TaxID=261697 RepID=A0AAN6YIY7_9PEZI|nr:hypothetical protein QBC37DRAFT_407958 [Rhypophila decipiens]